MRKWETEALWSQWIGCVTIRQLTLQIKCSRSLSQVVYRALVHDLLIWHCFYLSWNAPHTHTHTHRDSGSGPLVGEIIDHVAQLAAEAETGQALRDTPISSHSLSSWSLTHTVLVNYCLSFPVLHAQPLASLLCKPWSTYCTLWAKLSVSSWRLLLLCFVTMMRKETHAHPIITSDRDDIFVWLWGTYHEVWYSGLSFIDFVLVANSSRRVPC